MVLKIDGVVAVGVERHKLAGSVHEPGGGDGFLAHLVHSRQQVGQDGLAGRVRLDLIHTMPIRRFHQKNGVGDGLPSVRVLFADDKVGALLVLNGQRGGLAGEQLHVVLPQVDDVVGHRGGFFDRVHPRLQLGDVDLTLIVCDTVQVVAAVLNPGNPEMYAAQPGAVRAGLDNPQRGLGRVGEHEAGVLVRVHLNDANSIVRQIPLRGLQLPHLIGAGGQLAEVDLAIDVRGELLPVAAAHQLELKADIGKGLHGNTVHLHQMNPRLEAVEEHQGLDAVPRLNLNLLGRAVHHVGVIRGDLLGHIGAGEEIIYIDPAILIRGELVIQLRIPVDRKGYIGQGPVGGPVNLEDLQTGLLGVGDDKVVGYRVATTGVHVDGMGSGVQNVVPRTGHLHEGIRPLRKPGQRIAAIHPDRVDVLCILEHVKYGREAVSGIRVLLLDFNSCQRVIAEGDVDRPLTVVVDGLHLVTGEVPLRRVLLINAEAAAVQALHDSDPIPAGGDGVVVGLVDALNAVGGPSQRRIGLAVPLRDGNDTILTRRRIVRLIRVLGDVSTDDNSFLIVIEESLPSANTGGGIDRPLAVRINGDMGVNAAGRIIVHLPL